MNEQDLLEKGLAQFRDLGGKLSTRYDPLVDWVDSSSALGLFQFIRFHDTAPNTESSITDFGGNKYKGINVASQDYLGLARHPEIIEAAVKATREGGTHSAGSEPMGGGLSDAIKLEKIIAEYTEHPNVVLFPTGWGAGYGGIKGIVRPNDFILLDALAHDCLQHGANSSSKNVVPFAHNDLDSLYKRLKKAKSKVDKNSDILVITESLFSMDSDHPNFSRFVEICKEFGATTMVDVAHDLGVLGPDGKGTLAESGVVDQIDYLIGSFSKTYACTGGFFASLDKGSGYAVRGFSGSYTFSNYLVPAQAAAVLKAFEIVTSSEGDLLRTNALKNAQLFKDLLAKGGLHAAGRLSSMIIVPIGKESIARPAYRRCMEKGLITNCIEFPACRRGEARFRFQVTPNHSESELVAAADIAIEAVNWAKENYS